MIYVLAGTYQQAKDAARDLPPRGWKYVGERRDLLGIRNGTYIVIGTFWERRDAFALYETALATGLTISEWKP